jgi:hypothetical protein
MGFFNIAGGGVDYIISNQNQLYRLSWQTGSIRYHLDLDLAKIIHSYIDEHLNNIVRLFRLLNGFEPDTILDDPMGCQIMTFIPIQPMGLEEGHTEWLAKAVIHAYNSRFFTQFTYDMVQGML